MGRGLSKLQRFIVTEAARRDRLYYADVLHHYYGFPPRRPLRYEKITRRTKYINGYSSPDNDASSWEDGGTLRFVRSQKFQSETIGERRYHAAHAALSRACRRLEARGLVTWLRGTFSHWAGVEITDKGRESLSVNLAVNVPPS
jgi:hypothetical protein